LQLLKKLHAAEQQLLAAFAAYFEELLVQPDNCTLIPPSVPVHPSNSSSIVWTGNKTDLVELIYALHLAGVFNNGKADVKLIATCLQQVFNIDLGNYYDLFQNIRMRKTGQLKFLDNMKAMLMKKMDEME